MGFPNVEELENRMKKPNPKVAGAQRREHHAERINNIKTKMGVRNGHHLHLVPKVEPPVSTTPPPLPQRRWWNRVLELFDF